MRLFLCVAMFFLAILISAPTTVAALGQQCDGASIQVLREKGVPQHVIDDICGRSVDGRQPEGHIHPSFAGRWLVDGYDCTTVFQREWQRQQEQALLGYDYGALYGDISSSVPLVDPRAGMACDRYRSLYDMRFDQEHCGLSRVNVYDASVRIPDFGDIFGNTYDPATQGFSYEVDIEVDDGLLIQQRFPQMATGSIWGGPTQVTERTMDISSVSAHREHVEFRDTWSSQYEEPWAQGTAIHMTMTTDYALDIKTPEHAVGTWKTVYKSIGGFARTSYCSQGVLDLYKISD